MSAEPSSLVAWSTPAETVRSRVGRYLVVTLFGLAVAVVGWQWRDLRAWAGGLSKVRAASRSETMNSAPAPDLASSSKLTPQSAPPQSAGPAAKQDLPPSKNISADVSPKEKFADANPQPAPSTTDDRTLESEGEKYLYGDGVPADCERARRDILAAAEQSSLKAESVLGTMYATGHCAQQDLPLAYRWFAKAHRQNPGNRAVDQDMKVLWSQMSPEQKQLADR